MPKVPKFSLNFLSFTEDLREDTSGILILWGLRVRSSLTSGITSLKVELKYFHKCQFLFSPKHSFFGHALLKKPKK